MSCQIEIRLRDNLTKEVREFTYNGVVINHGYTKFTLDAIESRLDQFINDLGNSNDSLE
jgi:hypothetical protein